MASGWFSLDQLREETPEERAAEEIRLRHEAQAREAQARESKEWKAAVRMQSLWRGMRGRMKASKADQKVVLTTRPLVWLTGPRVATARAVPA